jgi:predicted methyltransferase
MPRRLTLRRLLGVLLILLSGVAAYATRRLWAGSLEEETARLTALLALEPGMTVAEVGAGEGRMAVLLAQRLGPEGRVYATEIDADSREAIQRAADKANVHNVTVLKAGDSNANLRAGCCEAIFMRRVYHHFTNPAAVNASLFEALRPDGRLAVIDFAPAWFLFWLGRPEGVPETRPGHGVEPEAVIQELTAAGFVLDRRLDDWGFRDYCLVFRRPGE